MNWLHKLFNKANANENTGITCPRCLGKGYVDMEDIKRLHQELRWRPGSCAYCNATGKVDENMESKIPVDTAFLTTNLSKEDREKLINSDSELIEKAHLRDMEFNRFIREIVHLYFTENMSAEEIADHFLSFNPATRSNNRQYESYRKELIEYVNRVIEFKIKGKS